MKLFGCRACDARQEARAASDAAHAAEIGRYQAREATLLAQIKDLTDKVAGLADGRLAVMLKQADHGPGPSPRRHPVTGIALPPFGATLENGGHLREHRQARANVVMAPSAPDPAALERLATMSGVALKGSGGDQ